MSSLTNYGQAIASTTIALQQLLTSPPVGLQATARAPGEARTGITGASVNLFLYSDSLISYREASAQHGPSRIIAELHYLVNAFPDGAGDLDSASHRAFGTARAAIERHPVLTVPVGAADSLQVWLTPSPLTTEVQTALWLASREPLRLSFGVMASFTLDAAERVALVGSVHDVVQLAGAGAIAVFSGTDAAAKADAAASVAHELGKSLVTVPLGSIVGRDMVETERNLSGLFDQAEHRGAVLLIDEAEALFGVRPEVLDVEDPYAEIDVVQLLDRLGAAPSVVIIALRDSAGDELADRTRVEVRFPSADPAGQPE